MNLIKLVFLIKRIIRLEDRISMVEVP